ncbi:hypothetical protein BD779DRAFT_1531689 [Infundibulicybe gibba]|nr:hypothetical protein BD779DRAFT_1531689 [Infundibulicybe gibba]
MSTRTSMDVAIVIERMEGGRRMCVVFVSRLAGFERWRGRGRPSEFQVREEGSGIVKRATSLALQGGGSGDVAAMARRDRTKKAPPALPIAREGGGKCVVWRQQRESTGDAWCGSNSVKARAMA